MEKQELRSPSEVKNAVFYYRGKHNQYLSPWQQFVLQCLYVLAENAGSRTLKIKDLEKRIYKLEKAKCLMNL